MILLLGLLVTVSAQPECVNMLRNVTEIEINFTDLPRGRRTYTMCPNHVYKPSRLNRTGESLDEFFPGDDYPLVVRSRATVKCGIDGKSSNNCVIDGTGTWGVLIDSFAIPSPELDRQSIVLQGFTFRGFVNPREPNTVLFFVAPQGGVTLQDCIFENVGSYSPFTFLQAFQETPNRALSNEVADVPYRYSDLDDDTKLKLWKDAYDSTSAIVNAHSIFDDHSRRKALDDAGVHQNIRRLNDTFDFPDFEEGTVVIKIEDCLFANTTMVATPQTNSAHTILYFSGVVVTNLQTPKAGKMNVRITGTKFQNIKGEVESPPFPSRRSIVEFQSNGRLFLEDTCFDDIKIPSFNVEAVILMHANSQYRDLGGNSVTNVEFLDGDTPNPDSGCNYVALYNLDNILENSYGFLSCIDDAFDFQNQCGGGGGNQPAPTLGVGICFSSENTAQLENGEKKDFDQLQLGDKVLTQKGFESIYSFGHYSPKEQAQFVQLLPSHIELSSTHLIFLQDGRAVTAESVEVGDILLSGELVTGKRYVTSRGLFAPFTASGTIIANGQVASSYVSLQGTSELEINGWSTGFSYHWMAHSFEVPHRLWCIVSRDVCLKESYTSDGISTWVSMPQKFFLWYLQSHSLTQALLVVPILSLFGILTIIGYMTIDNQNQAVAFTCLVAAATYIYLQWRIRKMK